MSAMLDLADQYFKRCYWAYARVAGRSDLIEVVFDNPRARWKSYAQDTDGGRSFLFYSVCAVDIAPARRPAVAEFLTRVNFGLVSGNFELDWDDGEVRFKTGIELDGLSPSAELVRALVQPNLSSVLRYLPGLLMVIRDEADPRTARSECDEVG